METCALEVSRCSQIQEPASTSVKWRSNLARECFKIKMTVCGRLDCTIEQI